MRNTIEALSGLFAPSGCENAVRREIIAKAETLDGQVREDRLGNLFVTLKGKKTSREPVFLFAHMDEPGLMVKQNTEEFWKFGLMGSTKLRMILGHSVLVGPCSRRGVIGMKPIHLSDKEERDQLPKQEDLYLDLGNADGLEPGMFGVFDEPLRGLGESRLYGKAMSRSVTAGVLLSLMRESLPLDVTMVFTVQRHVGSRGARAAAAGLSGVAMVLDLCAAGNSGETLPQLGKGPVIPVMDQGIIYDDTVQNALKKSAARKNISIQAWASLSGRGDGESCQRTGTGLRIGGLLCPAELTDAPGQIVSLSDIQAMRPILMGFLEEQI